MGRGEGSGTGKGSGQGEGSGEDTATNAAIGGAVAVGLVVFMCICGLPMIVAGAVFMNIFLNGTTMWNVGLALIVVSSVFLFIGLILMILICAGVCENKSNTATVGPAGGGPGTVVVNHSQAAPYGQPPPPYSTPGLGYAQPGTGYAQPATGYAQPATGYSQPPPQQQMY